MTSDVVARCNRRRDIDDIRVVVGNQLVRCPGTGVASADESTLIDLEELESRLVNTLAWAVAVGEVGQDWTVVRIWPDSPLEFDLIASSDDCMRHGIGCVQVTDDVRAVVVLDESIALIGRVGPADDIWCWVLVLERRIIALVPDSTGYDTLDTTVSSDA